MLLLHNTHIGARGAAFVLRAIPNLTLLGNYASTTAGLKRLYELMKRP
jgi:hypothetical protein